MSCWEGASATQSPNHQSWFNRAYRQGRTDRTFEALLAPIMKLHDAAVLRCQAATCAAGGDARPKEIGDGDPRFQTLPT